MSRQLQRLEDTARVPRIAFGDDEGTLRGIITGGVHDMTGIAFCDGAR